MTDQERERRYRIFIVRASYAVMGLCILVALFVAVTR